MKKNSAAAALAAALLAGSPAYAVDSVSMEIGRGTEQVNLWRLGAQWKWQKKWLTDGDWHLGGYWDAQIGQWHGTGHVTDLGLTPVFRLEQKSPGSVAPYFEGAIGFHYLSDTQISGGKIFSTHFQFGDHIGAGMRFGEQRRYDLSLRLQHLSNGGIKHPNPGINFGQVRFQYHFD